MTARPTGRRQPCTLAEARARLQDAEGFLEAADISTNSDVIATNAIHAAIAAADAICCVALRERSTDGNHAAATELLGRIDPRFAAALTRALSRKTQAAYEARNVSAADATSCVRQATMLVEAARARVRGT
jgi:hypothetical protein